MTGIVRLANAMAAAEIAAMGAELRAWSVDGVPLLWTPDPVLWSETAPILFPVVGWTRGGRVRVAGRSYPLGLHGFARTQPFRLAEHGADHARFVLESSPVTLAFYPFAFVLSVTYRLDGAALVTTLDVANTGEGPMLYACGLHPGFRWPFAGGRLQDYAVLFDACERTDVPVVAADGLFTQDRRAIAWDGRRLDLSADLFAGEALCLLDARSTSLRFVHRAGAAINLRLEGFPHVALWSRPAGRFLSIEAWTGYGDRSDTDGDLATKPSMIALPRGAGGRHVATYSFDATGPNFFFGDSSGES